MNIIGLDIGTTSINAARLNPLTTEVAQTYTIPNQSFLKTEHTWERVQNPQIIISAVRGLLDEILDSCPGVPVIGLTGQMHGIVYVDESGQTVSPLYTWQDGRGNLPGPTGKSLCQQLTQAHGGSFYSGYGLVTHLYNLRNGLVPSDAAKVCTIMDYLGMALELSRCTEEAACGAAIAGFTTTGQTTWQQAVGL